MNCLPCLIRYPILYLLIDHLSSGSGTRHRVSCYLFVAGIGTSGDWPTGNDVSGPLFSPLFSIFFHSIFSVATFSHRRSAQIKKLLLRKLTGAPKNLGVDHFPTPSAILRPPGGHFEVLIEGMIESKNLFNKS